MIILWICFHFYVDALLEIVRFLRHSTKFTIATIYVFETAISAFTNMKTTYRFRLAVEADLVVVCHKLLCQF